MARRSPTEPRRLPTQARAQSTVQKILKAATQVLERLGYDDTTTNHIARQAKISVGSLYQYFPSKDAIVLALWEERIETDYLEASQRLEELKGLSIEEFFSTTLRHHFESFVKNARLKVELLRVCPRLVDNKRVLDVHLRFAGLIEALLEHHRERIHVKDPALVSQILVNSIMGNIQTYAGSDPKRLADPKFQDEVVRLCLCFIKDGKGGT